MLTISAQQAAFYTQNGFLELEGVFSPSECDALLVAVEDALEKRGCKDRKTCDIKTGRDLWRDAPLLKNTLLSKKCSHLALNLTRKPTLRLAFDQWFPENFTHKTPEKAERFFSIQGLAVVLFIQLDAQSVQSAPSPLGLSPFPEHQGSIKLIRPSLLLTWPKINEPTGLYCVGFCLATSVYVQNTSDPANLSLRKLDYGYGDPLRNDTHPLIHS